jgi:lysophospholipase L1-like esterase
MNQWINGSIDWCLLSPGLCSLTFSRYALGRMARPILKKAALSAVSLLITLITLESALRLCGYNPPSYLRRGTDYTLRPSGYPSLTYELSPGAATKARGKEIKINSQGFRGPEPSSDPALARVIVIGDSITFGDNLALEETFPFLLQQELSSQGRNLEVLNFGVPGYDTLQEVSSLEIRGLKYHPDVVVVAYCLNDVSISSVSLEQIQRMQRLRTASYYFLYESRLVDLVAQGVEKLRIKNWEKHVNEPAVFRREYANQIDSIGDDESDLLGLMGQTPTWPNSTWYGDRDRVGRLRFGFRRLASLSRENGFRVVIMIIPLLLEKGGVYSYRVAHRIVEMEARRAGFDTIDLTDDFMRVGMTSLRLTSGDLFHPNKIGHAIMANSLAPYVNQHLKPRPGP